MKRYVSLDVLRGLTVAFMCIVNNPGSWGRMYPPLHHAGWDGCTPTDLVYPFFLFCAGCAMAFSFSKFEGFSKKAALKIMRRGIGIFIVGLLCNLYPFVPTQLEDPSASWWWNFVYWLKHKRIMGVLQRIGLSYLVGGTIAMWLRKPSKIIYSILTLMTVFTLVLVIFGKDPGPFTLEGNIAGPIDKAVFGSDHIYHGYKYSDGTSADFDPEGLLGCLTGACTLLLGYLIGGTIIRSGRRAALDPSSHLSSTVGVCARIFAYGCMCLALGKVMSIWIPINKPLWSASYVLYAGGWSMIVLGFLSYWIDVRGYEKGFTFFKIMGTNALTAFVMSAVIAKTNRLIGFVPARYFGKTEFLSLCWALIFMMIIFTIQFFLYKKKIVIKI